ncbi:MAG TPA: lysine 5,6-aminomutase subunit alpha [Streptosporangiaceae bacterium]|nr:lysine 5,6-aminomutase subunit alpha [Streptosporangiaceae bacterium]
MLNLDRGVVDGCHAAAVAIAHQVTQATQGKTTVSVERAIVRLLGVDGVDDMDVPLPNVLVDHIAAAGCLGQGAANWLGRALVRTSSTPQQIAEAVAHGDDPCADECAVDPDKSRRAVMQAADAHMTAIADRMRERVAMRERLSAGAPPFPLRYVLTATGNIHEDIVHATAVAEHGGDIIALIRSTAQSLLDYVPYGATTEGYGGTFATQENFRLIRQAMDEWSEANGRYVRVSSFCSGLCMPEIAAIGAIEGLDNMVNDALYGILYRDINPLRTLIDQQVSRYVNGYFGIVINTGEDNYLRTADSLTAAPSVVASQFINLYLARSAGIADERVALGNAFEIAPEETNGLLLEWAQALLSRELFPQCPVKYMPPTRFMDGNQMRTQACDTLFNLVTTATGQAIQTIGVPTEAIFTPHIHDRVFGLENARYVANFARDIGKEIEFKHDGLIQTRARDVLARALDLLHEIAKIGIFDAIAAGMFGEVRRDAAGGRGAKGIVPTEPAYYNPCIEFMTGGNDG